MTTTFTPGVTSTTANALTSSTSPNRPASSTDFNKQLSEALADSLARLGIAPGEINISIRNTAGSVPTRQIVITYSGTDASSTAASGASGSTATSASTRTTAPTAGNPFLGSSSGSSTSTSTPATSAAVPVVSTSWSPWTGPVDRHDAIPTGGGQVAASGAPLIQPNATPVSNQYNYTGPAALNPYFTTPSNPLRDGYVLGFGNWFQEAQILGSKNGPTPANKTLYTTEDGANEALRLVQQYAPGAKIVQQTWGSGVFTANKPMYMIQIGDGKYLNAGGLLDTYYYGGRGVTTASDADLKRTIEMASA